VTFTLIGRDGRPRASSRPGKLGGHRRTKIYGRLDCRAARAALARGGYAGHRVFFATAADAVAAGYRPCAVCLPGEYARWRLRSRRAG
jgi:methylphosphotriester-DNA--protein-cysteine methyltransferase